ncbi:Uncharacterized protein FKW44_019034, partial [Caligus rogercresseyi]
IQLRIACGTTGYEMLLQKGFPLPSLRTLRRRLESLEFNPGILEDVMELMK